MSTNTDWNPRESRHKSVWGSHKPRSKQYLVSCKGLNLTFIDQREQNAWDFLQGLAHPESIAIRWQNGEEIWNIATGYNNVSHQMLAKFMITRFGAGWKEKFARVANPDHYKFIPTAGER